ncbi:ATP-binding cassette domain-containing protein [Streptomyces sp. NPDC017413]|uniref:ATP-binding cassette domain-containing protein n=1 Tax=Streptomyces sp. NPDC017413 TaxID=3364994 RepID=UPI003795D173
MELQDVGHRYGLRGAWVLRGVELTLPERTLVRVEGGNGAGKSTLLRLLAGVDAPAEGRITGRRTRTAYVPERFPAALPLTATGYLVHLGRIHGLRSAQAKRRAGEWLTRFGAADHARTPLAALSKGTSQKVAVAQALLAEPDLLVLDEAWTGLDTSARAELDRAVAERVAAGATVVFVDHDPRRLAGAADLILRTGGGRVRRAPAPTPTGPAPGPRVLIEAEGPPGAPLPSTLPGAPVRELVTGAAPGLVRLTVPTPYSDALLAALLTARPPWHIRRVAPSGASGPSEARGPAEAEASAQMSVQSGRTEAPEVSEAP